MLTKAYSPEQSAVGKLDSDQEVVIIYIKEYSAEVAAINAAGLSNFTYDWFANEQKDAYVLKVQWENDMHIAVRFNQIHFKLLAKMIDPCDLILTTAPISELISSAEQQGANFLEFKEVLTFHNIQFVVPNSSTVLN